MEKKYLLSMDNIKEIIKLKGSCIASDRITINGKKIGYMYRENPSNEADTGWRFFAGDETEEFTNNPNNFEIYELNTICNYDETIIPYLMENVGTKLERNNDEFKKVD